MSLGSNQEAIQDTIQSYVKGYLQADSEELGRAFHRDTKLLTVDQGSLEKTEMKDWLSNLDQRKKVGDLRTGKFEILSIDVTGDSAVAKLKLALPKIKFTDYLSLLRINKEWKIVGKIYSFEKLN